MSETIENRKEWLKKRQSGIGGSDAPILTFDSDYGTPLSVYESKKVEDIQEKPANFAIEMGNEAEPKIRELFEKWFCKEFGFDFLNMPKFPAEFGRSSQVDFLIASFDSINIGVQFKIGETIRKGTLAEYKLLNQKDWMLAKTELKVPRKYWVQIQHQLMVSGLKVGFFAAYKFGAYKDNRRGQLTMDNLAVVLVEADEEFQKRLFDIEKNFWIKHVLKNVPPEPCDRDFVAVTGHAELSKKWIKLKEKIKKLQEEIEQVETDLKTIADTTGENRILCAGIKIQKVFRAGNVNYKSIPELKNVDLEKYRGKQVSYWKLTPYKED